MYGKRKSKYPVKLILLILVTILIAWIMLDTPPQIEQEIQTINIALPAL
ncbi:hypothetical protein AwWohl_07040 [Gammaproteobacteria bacterium]|nr:hypothetical protein AwWohl_07040 [Gammaproteobacteria bacterium]